MKQALKPQCVFARVEKKYLIPVDTCRKFLKAMGDRMVVDEYGKHTICNLYYDTEQFDLIRRSIEGPRYKEKLRLRSYGVPDKNSTVFLEIKKKWKKVVYKRRVPMKLWEAEVFMERGILPRDIAPEDRQIFKELAYFREFYKPEARVFLAYDRVACYCPQDTNIRMTFDAAVRRRYDDLRLDAGDRGERLLPPGQYVVEIKVGDAFPLWLTDILSELAIYPASFSKYGQAYKKDKKSGIIAPDGQVFIHSKEGEEKPCLQVS